MARKRSGDEGLHRSNIDWFTKATEQKPTVLSVEHLGGRIFKVVRDRDDLTVYLANIYILGEADAEEILSANPGLDAIVNVNSYNSYTNAAKELARSRGIALFRAAEFMGAVYRYGRDFMEYSPPKTD